MELAECSLWSVVSKPSTSPDLPLALAMAWLTDICAAVAHLYKKMVTYKDIKAENILVCTSPYPLVVKLCDFGLAEHYMRRT